MTCSRCSTRWHARAGSATTPTWLSSTPQRARRPGAAEIRARLARSAGLDPARRSRTTTRPGRTVARRPDEQGRAAAAYARGPVPDGQQLTRQRIASGLDTGFTVATKSSGLMGIVRNEAGVVTAPTGVSYAVAIFTRCHPDLSTEPAAIDTTIVLRQLSAVYCLIKKRPQLRAQQRVSQNLMIAANHGRPGVSQAPAVDDAVAVS